jgi:predicted O-methyltransferase YrrM
MRKERVIVNKTIALDGALYRYFREVGFREPEILAELRQATAAFGQDASMQIAPEQGAFMAMLVRLTGARRILEIGTFTGYSTLAMALAMPPDGRIVASDVSREWTDVGREHWLRAGVADHIELRLAKGRDTIANLLAAGRKGAFDMIFIDADKKSYDIYYEGGLKLLRPGGLMLLDNVLWGGKVATLEADDLATSVLRTLNTKIHADPRVSLAMIPIADGVTMVRKN